MLALVASYLTFCSRLLFSEVGVIKIKPQQQDVLYLLPREGTNAFTERAARLL